MKKLLFVFLAISMIAGSAAAAEQKKWWGNFSFDACMKQASTLDEIQGCQLKNKLAKKEKKARKLALREKEKKSLKAVDAAIMRMKAFNKKWGSS